MKNSKTIEVKPYSISELADIYEVPLSSFRKWMKKLEKHTGERIGRFYNVNQVEIVFDKLGVPKRFDVD